MKLLLKLWKGLGSPVINVTLVKKDSLLVYVLKFFGFLAGRCPGRCGYVVVRERDLNYRFFRVSTFMKIYST